MRRFSGRRQNFTLSKKCKKKRLNGSKDLELVAGAGMFLDFTPDELYKRYHQIRRVSLQEEHTGLLRVGPLGRSAECPFSIDQDDSILDITNNREYGR